MLEVLLDWRGDESVDEARLAADLGELAFDYVRRAVEGSERSGRCCTEYRRSCASTRSCCRPISLSCSRRSSVSRGSAASTIPEFRLVDRVEPFLNRAMSERYQPVDALRRGQATLSDFLGLVASMPRDLARLVKDARHGRMRVDLDLKRLDTLR